MYGYVPIAVFLIRREEEKVSSIGWLPEGVPVHTIVETRPLKLARETFLSLRFSPLHLFFFFFFFLLNIFFRCKFVGDNWKKCT